MEALKNILTGAGVVGAVAWVFIALGRAIHLKEHPEDHSGWWELLWSAPLIVIALALVLLVLWAIGEKLRNG